MPWRSASRRGRVASVPATATTSIPGRRASASRCAPAAKPVPTTPTRIRPASVTGRGGSGKEEEAAAAFLLLADLDPHQDQPFVDQTDHQRPEQCTDNGRTPAEEARPAQDHRRDDRELVALAPLEAAGLKPARVEH